MIGRREALLSAVTIFMVALLVRAWVAAQITFPRPEDVAYYVGVSRNMLEGRGITSDAIWSFQTPPLSFPRPAFEVWLPLPTFLMAVPMAIFGPTFGAAQVASVIVGSLVCVLAWRLAADVAAFRGMPVGRARTLAAGAGLTCAAYLPLVLASGQPDSTMPFAALVLLGCLLITKLSRQRLVVWRSRVGLALGVVLGLAAMTRNEALWLGLAFVLVEWSNARQAYSSFSDRLGAWGIRVIPVAFVAFLVFLPWMLRDWVAFGSPLPGQALTNALSLDGRDIFAWHDQPTLARYLAAGPVRLLELRWIGIVHNVTQVLLFLGVPLSIVGLIGLTSVVRWNRPALSSTGGRDASGRTERRAPSASPNCDVGSGTAAPEAIFSALRTIDPLRPLVIFSGITFLVASLLFPVSTTWGTFLHAAGAIHVLLVISALLVLDALVVAVGRRRGWTNPVAWLGPAFAIAGCLLFTFVQMTEDGRTAAASARHYAALAEAFSRAPADGTGVDLVAERGPVITDSPIWFAEATGHQALALPNESIDSVLDLASSFDPPARLLVVGADNGGVFPATILNGDPRADCFVPVSLPDLRAYPGELDDILVFRIRC